MEQTLGYTAKLRLPNATTKQKEEKVNEVIDLLNLNKARNTLIGGAFQRGVSGGNLSIYVYPYPIFRCDLQLYIIYLSTNNIYQVRERE